MIYQNEGNIFHLQTRKTSYIFRAIKSGQLESMYYGKRIRNNNDFEYLFDKHAAGFSNATPRSQDDPSLSLDHFPMEYSTYGKGDYRLPAMQILSSDDIFTTDFLFKSASVGKNKPELNGLPSSYGESETLTITLEDKILGAELKLFYTVFEECDVITRAVRLINTGKKSFHIQSIMSMQLDLPMDSYTAVTFDGAWVRERFKNEHKLTSGEFSVGSIAGYSSNRHNPFFIIKRGDCNEQNGECFGFNLVYSGNHIARTEVSTHGMLRIQNGINPFQFDWLLKPGAEFDTPESVMTFSDEGMNGMSHNMHAFVKEHIVRGQWKNKERPILVNNWEATYFAFTEKKILEIAKAGADLGLEMFVLDDGWFGKRNNDKSSLGDWYINKKKLPSGLEKIAKQVNDYGMMFGLWVEPEMVSPDSDLYRAHPEWAIKTDVYEPSQGRNQLVLDLSNNDVVEYLINTMTDVFRYGNIEYIKWDNNRQMSDIFSHSKAFRSGEFFHKYIIGLYKLWDSLTERFPKILFEACSSGGNRFDLGTFCYMPQCWTSDNTDPIDRIYIQQGTSYGYPQSVMTMHVSDSPSFAEFRATSIEERFNVASFGLLGYELDVTNLNKFDKAAMRKQVEYYKKHRALLQFGEFSRIGDFFTDNVVKWQITAPDKSESMLGWFINRTKPNYGDSPIRFVDLDEEKDYSLSMRPQLLSLKNFAAIINSVMPKKFDIEEGKVWEFITETIKLRTEDEDRDRIGGDSLMFSGFKPQQHFVLAMPKNLSKARMILDADSRMYYLKEKE